MCSDRDELERFRPESEPSYRQPGLSTYSMLREVGSDEASDPLHFGASLVEAILRTPNQELGTHTFSYYYCLEEGPSLEDFDRDLVAARRLAKERWGVDGRSTRIVRRYLAQHFEVSATIIEPAVSALKIPTRRAKRMGLSQVAGQVAFQLMVGRVLLHTSQARIEAILKENGLDDAPLPSEAVDRVQTVNGPACRAILAGLSPSLVVINGRGSSARACSARWMRHS